MISERDEFRRRIDGTKWRVYIPDAKESGPPTAVLELVEDTKQTVAVLVNDLENEHGWKRL